MFGWNNSPSASPHRDNAYRAGSMRSESTVTESCCGPRSASVATSEMSGISASTAMSVGDVRKARQIRDLKLELELRDHRIEELESAYEESERMAAFSRGEFDCKLSAQTLAVSGMQDGQKMLQSTIEEQKNQMSEMRTAIDQYSSMATAFNDMMGRCAQLEKEQAAERKRREEEDAAKAAAALENVARIARIEDETRAAAVAKIEEMVAEQRARDVAAAAAADAAAAAAATAPPSAAPPSVAPDVHVAVTPTVFYSARSAPHGRTRASKRDKNVGGCVVM